MVYLGSKRRIAKHIVPIIQSYINENTTGYLEPFVGGANIIDKIVCPRKEGHDVHKQLIALLRKAQQDIDNIPDFISEEEYHKVRLNRGEYPDWYVGLVGFCSTYSSKYFGGYVKPEGNCGRVLSEERIRNLKKQAKDLCGINFLHNDFREITPQHYSDWVIYCDPPYKGATGYATGGAFPYDEFYSWCKKMALHNMVLISEYNMPEGFECIFEIPQKVLVDSGRTAGDSGNNRVEKLFIVK